mgnify:CR=1 FL=1
MLCDVPLPELVLPDLELLDELDGLLLDELEGLLLDELEGLLLDELDGFLSNEFELLDGLLLGFLLSDELGLPVPDDFRLTLSPDDSFDAS